MLECDSACSCLVPPVNRLVIHLVLNYLWFAFLHHADAVMELLCLLCVKHIEAFLTNKFIPHIWVFLLQVITERFLCAEVSAGTVWAHELPLVSLCYTVDESAYVVDEGVVGGLLILVVEDVDNLFAPVHPYIKGTIGHFS